LATRSRVFEELSDLANYPRWMSVVRRADPVPAAEVPTWDVTLTGAVGKLRRSKRIRMTRTEQVSHSLIVFERREIDARSHSSWTLRVDISSVPEVEANADVAEDAGTLIRVGLNYDGRLWEPLVERMLRGEIERSRAKLELILAEGN
jgi:Polyketide cyclase / dehydrase and lipid transport